MKHNIKRTAAAALAFSLLFSAAVPAVEIRADETTEVYVVSSVSYKLSDTGIQDEYTGKLSYYDNGLLKQEKITGRIVDSNVVPEETFEDIAEPITNDYSMKYQFTYSDEMMLETLKYSGPENISSDESEPASWERSFILDDEGRIKKCTDELEGTIKYVYKDDRLFKMKGEDSVEKLFYTDDNISRMVNTGEEDGSKVSVTVDFQRDAFGNVQSEKLVYKITENNKTRKEKGSVNYELIYKDDRLQKVSGRNSVFRFKYKKLTVPAENAGRVMQQQRYIVGQYSSLSSLYMFY